MNSKIIVAICLGYLCSISSCKKKETVEQEMCEDDCRGFNSDGECDDGESGSLTNLCKIGTDCSDCGVRLVLVEIDK